MPARQLWPLLGLLLLPSGCLWPVREMADHSVYDIAAHPFDAAPVPPPEPSAPGAPGKEADKKKAPDKKNPGSDRKPIDLQTTAMLQADAEDKKKDGDTSSPPRLDLKIPPKVPGSEVPRIQLKSETREGKIKEIRELFPPLPPLPTEPVPLPGPNGRPYTLTDLQELAARNSPTLRQAAFDVESARGNLIQARMYPNPTVGYEQDPSNDGSTAGVVGMFVDQVIKTGGKLKLAAAAAQKDLDNALLALKRARCDLSTNVRSAYFAFLVAGEAMQVNRAMARLTDEIYRNQAILLQGGFAAHHEPAVLRAQAYTARLAHKQAISTYIYAWKQLVAAIGLCQLPLTQVSGRIDRLIPCFDYDTVLHHVLRHHTDVLTAQNTFEKARFQLKMAQLTPLPDVEVRFAILKETALFPFQWVHTLQVGGPIPIWDKNKGNIIAAQGNLGRACEEAHRVEMALTNTLAANYTTYKNNLQALEYYRRYILPDQVRYYRGVYARRGADLNVSFNDLVTAQQTLATNVASYLTILGSLWNSVVSVADLLQTDDLFQLAKPQKLPALPNLVPPPPWHCCHGCPATQPAPPSHPAGPATQPVPARSTKPAPSGKPAPKDDLPAPRRLETPTSTGTALPAPRPLPPLASAGSGGPLLPAPGSENYSDGWRLP